jgi:hypothetical protein
MLQCVTLWIGERLGAVERACLRSVLRQGHRVGLYCYRPPMGIPAGIEAREAAEILPESNVFRTRGGSVAAFSDWFRYELQRSGAGTWLDTDMYLLRPLDVAKPYLFGEEANGILNNAVLRLPQDSPMLDGLLSPFTGRTPDWLAPRAKFLSRVRERVLGSASVSSMPWGTTGPAALSAVAKSAGLAGAAEPQDVFYPVTWQRANWILDPKTRLEDVVTDRTVGLHLWNEIIKMLKSAPGPPGSFLERLQREGK